MIVGTGTDIVSIARIQDVWERFGDKFAKRLLAAQEWEGYQKATDPPAFLAKRFAAKEAFVKALRIGMRGGLAFNQIAVGHDDLGAPHLVCTERAAYYLKEKHINHMHLSIADEQDFATAFVVLER
jgi:holo-[acyl-carrier protein] synthase